MLQAAIATAVAPTIFYAPRSESYPSLKAPAPMSSPADPDEYLENTQMRDTNKAKTTGESIPRMYVVC